MIMKYLERVLCKGHDKHQLMVANTVFAAEQDSL